MAAGPANIVVEKDKLRGLVLCERKNSGNVLAVHHGLVGNGADDPADERRDVYDLRERDTWVGEFRSALLTFVIHSSTRFGFLQF